MSAVKELLRTEENGKLSFGDHTLTTKAKKDDFPYEGDVYKVKTFSEITKLEKNGLFLYESVPGTSVNNFKEDVNGISFTVEGPDDAQITLGLLEDTDYAVIVDHKDTGHMKTNLGGKLSISVELGTAPVNIKVQKA
ncbi:MAG: endosialidase [Lachnospiraceae bacterium]|nr:endosialidase [Lachnospiraceae bacterium]